MESKPNVGKIEQIKADVIVNSVGVGKGVTEYGGICGSIIKVADSKLKDIIDKAKDVYVLGEFFVTSGHGLPASNIIHLMAPYYEQDSDYFIYKDCIRRVLRECVHRGFKTIAIPLVGTGANKYPEQETYETLLEIANAFNNAFSGEYRVSIVAPDPVVKAANKDRLDSLMPIDGRRRNIEKDVKKGTGKYLKEHGQLKNQIYNRDYFEFDETEDSRPTILPSSFKKQPGDVIEYADYYTEKRYLFSEELEKAANERVRAFVGFGSSDPKTAGSKAMSQITPYSDINRYFVMIFGLKMSVEEGNAFLNYFGKGYPSPKIYPQIDKIKELLAKKIYDLYEIKGIVDIFS